MQLSGITVPFTYNVQLKKALEQKVIMKVQHDRMTYYQPAPFRSLIPLLYLSPYGGLRYEGEASSGKLLKLIIDNG